MNEPKLMMVWNYGGGYFSKNVYHQNGIAPTILTGNHGLGTTVMVEEENESGKLEDAAEGQKV